MQLSALGYMQSGIWFRFCPCSQKYDQLISGFEK